MQRICFTLRLREEHLEEYVERHKHVWPEMQDALHATGWTNYSLFLAGGGLLIGYVEVENFDAAREGMKAFPVNARWQLEMAPFFDNTGDSSCARPDDVMQPLREVFHLD